MSSDREVAAGAQTVVVLVEGLPFITNVQVARKVTKDGPSGWLQDYRKAQALIKGIDHQTRLYDCVL